MFAPFAVTFMTKMLKARFLPTFPTIGNVRFAAKEKKHLNWNDSNSIFNSIFLKKFKNHNRTEL